MSLPIVSVIIRAYNPNEWILEAVNSIIKQTYEGRIETIVCYDKASRTNEILDKLKQYASQTPRNRVIRIVEHEPMSPAQAFFECGLQLSSGDYVMFLDYDNVMPENYINEVIRQIKNSDCLCTNPMLMGEDGEILGHRLMKIPTDGISIASLAKGNFCDTNGIVLSRKAVSIILKLYNELYNKYLRRMRLLIYLLVDDYLVSLTCTKIFQIKCIDNAYVYYRVHRDQLVRPSSPTDIAKINQIRIRDIVTLYIALLMLEEKLTTSDKTCISVEMINRLITLISSTLGRIATVKVFTISTISLTSSLVRKVLRGILTKISSLFKRSI